MTTATNATAAVPPIPTLEELTRENPDIVEALDFFRSSYDEYAAAVAAQNDVKTYVTTRTA